LGLTAKPTTAPTIANKITQARSSVRLMARGFRGEKISTSTVPANDNQTARVMVARIATGTDASSTAIFAPRTLPRR